MKSTLIALLLPGLALSAAVVAPPAPVSDVMTIPNLLAERAVSPNKTCGNSGPGGSTQGWTCPSDAACCSVYGYCGTGDEFCLTTGGCQTRFSNSSSACQAPRSGVTVSIDGTCGSVGVGKAGYRCPGTIATCCSASYVFFPFSPPPDFFIIIIIICFLL